MKLIFCSNQVQHGEKDAMCNQLTFILLFCFIWFSLILNYHFILCPHQEVIPELLSECKQTHYMVKFFDISNKKKIPENSCGSAN